MAAIDLTAPAYLPFVTVTASVPTTCQKYSLPPSHGPLLLTVYGSAALRFATDTALSDGGAMGSNFRVIPATTDVQIRIPPTSKGGVSAVYIAAATGTATVTLEVNRDLGQ